MKLTKNSPSDAFPRDLVQRIYSALAPNISALATISNPANLNRDLGDIVNKQLFPHTGVLELPDSYQSPKTGTEFLFFIAGALVASKIRDELDMSVSNK